MNTIASRFCKLFFPPRFSPAKSGLYSAWGLGDSCLDESRGRSRLVMWTDVCLSLHSSSWLCWKEPEEAKRREVGLDFSFNILFLAVSSHNNELVKGRCCEKW